MTNLKFISWIWSTFSDTSVRVEQKKASLRTESWEIPFTKFKVNVVCVWRQSSRFFYIFPLVSLIQVLGLPFFIKNFHHKCFEDRFQGNPFPWVESFVFVYHACMHVWSYTYIPSTDALYKPFLVHILGESHPRPQCQYNCCGDGNILRWPQLALYCTVLVCFGLIRE